MPSSGHSGPTPVGFNQLGFVILEISDMFYFWNIFNDTIQNTLEHFRKQFKCKLNSLLPESGHSQGNVGDDSLMNVGDNLCW